MGHCCVYPQLAGLPVNFDRGIRFSRLPPCKVTCPMNEHLSCVSVKISTVEPRFYELCHGANEVRTLIFCSISDFSSVLRENNSDLNVIG